LVEPEPQRDEALATIPNYKPSHRCNTELEYVQNETTVLMRF
jgi:hypothetical protein